MIYLFIVYHSQGHLHLFDEAHIPIIHTPTLYLTTIPLAHLRAPDLMLKILIYPRLKMFFTPQHAADFPLMVVASLAQNVTTNRIDDLMKTASLKALENHHIPRLFRSVRLTTS